MEVSADTLAIGERLTGQIVVVGAGPAGIVTALELADRGVDVLLIESGRWGRERKRPRRSEPYFAGPSAHDELSVATRRQVGGTSVIWGGRCVPYDPVDFDARPYVPQGAWPFPYEEVSRYHGRACDYFHCGVPSFDAMELPELSGRLLAPGLENGSVRASDLERWSLPTDFGKEYGTRLKSHPRLRLVTGLTCVEVVCHPAATAVAHLRCVTQAGREVEVLGDDYVLAAGGLEVTRLLLNSDRVHPGGLGNHSDHLGRWYMAHLDGKVASIEFSGNPRQTLIAHERDAHRIYVRRRLSFSRETLHEHELPNIVAWPVNPSIADASHGNGTLSFAYLGLSSRIGHRFVAEGIRRVHVRPDASPGADHVRNLLDRPLSTGGFLASFGYRRYLRRRRAPGFFVRTADNRYPLKYHGEQVPNRESRITLTTDRDALGMRRPLVDLRFSEQDFDGVLRAHELWHDHLVRRGAGRLVFEPGDLKESVARQSRGGSHQIGTTRMSRAPEDGVLAPDGTVHGVGNLSVVSSSAFCSSSQANPTFMVVVLALRRADALLRSLNRATASDDSAPAAARATAR